MKITHLSIYLLYMPEGWWGKDVWKCFVTSNLNWFNIYENNGGRIHSFSAKCVFYPDWHFKNDYFIVRKSTHTIHKCVCFVF